MGPLIWKKPEIDRDPPENLLAIIVSRLQQRARMEVVRKECPHNSEVHMIHSWRENRLDSPLYICFGTKNKESH